MYRLVCFSFSKPVLQLFSFPSCTSAKSWPVSLFSIACLFLCDSREKHTHTCSDSFQRWQGLNLNIQCCLVVVYLLCSLLKNTQLTFPNWGNYGTPKWLLGKLRMSMLLRVLLQNFCVPQRNFVFNRKTRVLLRNFAFTRKMLRACMEGETIFQNIWGFSQCFCVPQRNFAFTYKMFAFFWETLHLLAKLE